MLGKLKYKVGDRVKVKSIEWYNENKDTNNSVNLFNNNGRYNFTEPMSKYCGKIVTICGVDNVDEYYYIIEDKGVYFWDDKMFDGKVEEQIENNSNNTISTSVSSLPVDINIGLVLVGGDRQEIMPCKGYEIVNENGKFYLVKSKYPKTYRECCEVLGIDTLKNTANGYKHKLLIYFQELLIARDAYWKVADEWALDYDARVLFFISNDRGRIVKEKGTTDYNTILVFPTKEMRDEFYENFKELIEQCKELL